MSNQVLLLLFLPPFSIFQKTDVFCQFVVASDSVLNSYFALQTSVLSSVCFSKSDAIYIKLESKGEQDLPTRRLPVRTVRTLLTQPHERINPTNPNQPIEIEMQQTMP
jgi:hypothetical protein